MWTFFEDGTFYSAVLDAHDNTILWVRTRDLNSAKSYSEFSGSSILEWPNRDYAYRVKTTKEEWEAFVQWHIQDMQATNFKSEVGYNLGHKEGKLFLNALHDVWAAMFEYQHEVKKTVTKNLRKKS